MNIQQPRLTVAFVFLVLQMRPLPNHVSNDHFAAKTVSGQKDTDNYMPHRIFDVQMMANDVKMIARC